MRRILVIRLGALGDFVQSFGPFQAIRTAHPDAHITLLTTTPFVELARLSPWFDTVECDPRLSWGNLPALLAFRQALRGYDRVYDLQTSSRTARYYALAGRPKTWCGHVGRSPLAHANLWRNDMHTRTRQRDQLRRAGIADVPAPDTRWLADLGPHLEGPYGLIVPGASPHRPAKRWPVRRYAELATRMKDLGLRPVVVGSKAEQPLAAAITQACPQALDLTGRTTLPELAGLAARAQVAVGNDTGPMHLAALMGCRSVVLFSADSNPALTAPLGRAPRQVCVLCVRDLATLSVNRVAAALSCRH
ncbi:glycosyltransferase family 9 protein [Acetobacter orleanensis]|uniref:Glycosyl transferase n=1 Tax=Acetobacter orleanensis TaxID=104099 RepID=A0A4Y3TIP0_9PROT|nr:glycosyltransferase family 9 protein [Acetobacter orleanensis]KXV62644.1 glycosyl transferase [Acetobacter orleanensis]PCD80168.1 glycosyltransferase family 9 protein [Acetobacter orleanensis]GAN68256.1 lipopolysaccharide heptosyl transferase/glycosyl transferase [Acetobacter orleanensis JCM 7639]GBR31231.1 lipopolysaccharide heptosyltransferase [Acetobacter orleanensis NRIC 0473]GEB82851.1 glycosyl transferase [Acetobacter orleanensis]